MTSSGIKFLLLCRRPCAVEATSISLRPDTPEISSALAGTGRPSPSAVSAFESTAMPMAWRPLST